MKEYHDLIEQKENLFMKEYKELCLKHKLTVGQVGWDNTPCLRSFDSEKELEEQYLSDLR